MRVSIALSLAPAFGPVLLHNGMGASRFNGLPSIPCPMFADELWDFLEHHRFR